ncbi:MAG: acyltransferase [Pirellulales bacterium]
MSLLLAPDDAVVEERSSSPLQLDDQLHNGANFLADSSSVAESDWADTGSAQLIDFESTSVLKETVPVDADKRSRRYQLIDAVKGIAALVIMAHHITLYSPFTDLADEIAGPVTIPLYNYGPLVVQVFMVFGGFALAMALPNELNIRSMSRSLVARYLRLAAPYLVTLGLVLIGWLVVGDQMSHTMVEQLSLGQLVAHLFFLQDVLGYGNLSAGTWYLCIDMQYIVLCLSVLCSATFMKQKLSLRASPVHMTGWFLAGLGTVSAWLWNLNSANDCWVFYFLCTLVLGTLLGWATQRKCSTNLVAIYIGSLVVSQVMELRLRIVVGLITAGFVLFHTCGSVHPKVPRLLLWLGRISYSLFLIHYLVTSLVMHWLESWVGDSPTRAILAMVSSMIASLGAAWLLNWTVEQPLQRQIRAWNKENPDSNLVPRSTGQERLAFCRS